MSATELPSGSTTVALRSASPTRSTPVGSIPRAPSSARVASRSAHRDRHQGVPGPGGVDHDVEPGRVGQAPHHLVLVDDDVGGAPKSRSKKSRRRARSVTGTPLNATSMSIALERSSLAIGERRGR